MCAEVSHFSTVVVSAITCVEMEVLYSLVSSLCLSCCMCSSSCLSHCVFLCSSCCVSLCVCSASRLVSHALFASLRSCLTVLLASCVSLVCLSCVSLWCLSVSLRVSLALLCVSLARLTGVSTSRADRLLDGSGVEGARGDGRVRQHVHHLRQ